ncbi:MAG: prepilin peptidase [Candidatus Latescibacterota bacterium]
MSGLLRDLTASYVLEWGMLCVILAVGCHTCYTDIHWRRIPNWATWGLLALGLLAQGGFWLMGQVQPEQTAVVLGVGLGIAFLLFVYGFWAPGDAKLFWAMLVALPPTLYRPRPWLAFEASPWALLLNALVLNFAAMGVYALVQRVRGRHGAAAAGRLGWRRLAQLALEIGGMAGLVMGVGAYVVGAPLTFAQAAVAVVVAYLVVDRLVPGDYRLVLAAPGLLWGVYVAWETQAWAVLLLLWAFGWLCHAVHDALAQRYRHFFRQVLPVEALEAGMTPCMSICGQGTRGGQMRYLCTEEVGEDVEEVLCYPGRPLSASKAQQLRTLGAQGLFAAFDSRIHVETSMPFAPSIVVATAVTALLGGSLVRPIGQLVGAAARALQ